VLGVQRSLGVEEIGEARLDDLRGEFVVLRERALERFAAPQDPIEMATFGETRIASEFCQVRIAGDVAALKGVMKLVLEAHDEALRNAPEALELYAEGEQEDGRRLPRARTLTELKADPEVADDISTNMVALIELRATASAAE